MLVTGATGYIGGRLVPRLLEAGHRVKVLVRTPAKIAGVPWLDDVEVVQSSLDDGEALRAALDGVDVLYYLVHSMAAGSGFEAKEKAMAATAARAAAAAGVDRIVYLGGLHPAGAELSTHMRSREAVGNVFLDSPVDAVVFQAGVVIGSGSASFEMIRHLSETLPLMPAPSWVRNKIEAIAVRDVLYYLVAAASLEGSINRTFDIGCRQVLSYAGMMKEYAAEAGLPHRVVLALPVPAPKLAGMWVALTTPIPLSMSLPLVESLQHDAVAREHDIDAYIPVPEGGLTPYRRAVALALGKERDGQVETTWASAGVDADPLPSDPEWSGHTVYVDERSFGSDVDPKHVWTVIEGIGGRNGWYSLPLAWQVRGWLDKLTGGAGLLRGRRHPHLLAEGEVVDWWRVERIDRGRLLRLRAEMRAPGRAWLELSVEPDGTGSRYRQRAIFFPKGLSGRLYWLAVLPFHSVIFPAMSRNITAAARDLENLESEPAGHTTSVLEPECLLAFRFKASVETGHWCPFSLELGGTDDLAVDLRGYHSSAAIPPDRHREAGWPGFRRRRPHVDAVSHQWLCEHFLCPVGLPVVRQADRCRRHPVPVLETARPVLCVVGDPGGSLFRPADARPPEGPRSGRTGPRPPLVRGAGHSPVHGVLVHDRAIRRDRPVPHPHEGAALGVHQRPRPGTHGNNL